MTADHGPCRACDGVGPAIDGCPCSRCEGARVHKAQDRAVEMAKDLLMVDFGPLLKELDLTAKESVCSVEKSQAFHRLVISLHAAKGMAEEFRRAHVAEKRQDLRAAMDAQLQERLAEIDAMTPAEEPRGVS